MLTTFSPMLQFFHSQISAQVCIFKQLYLLCFYLPCHLPCGPLSYRFGASAVRWFQSSIVIFCLRVHRWAIVWKTFLFLFTGKNWSFSASLFYFIGMQTFTKLRVYVHVYAQFWFSYAFISKALVLFTLVYFRVTLFIANMPFYTVTYMVSNGFRGILKSFLVSYLSSGGCMYDTGLNLHIGVQYVFYDMLKQFPARGLWEFSSPSESISYPLSFIVQ